MMPVRVVVPCIALAAALSSQESPTWSNWRGPDGTGAAPSAKPPTRWSEEENIRWKTALPGVGCSSPVVHEDRIYLTTAIETDEEGAAPDAGEQPPPRGGRGGRGGRGMGPRSTKVHEFAVLCIDRDDGGISWRTTVSQAMPHEGNHPTGSLASASPLTDGERIWAFFGSRGLHCLDLNGKVKWSADFGQMRVRGQFGEGSSPALHGDTLVVNWDHEGESFITALDARTGKERWRAPRTERTTWATPIVVEVAGKPQVIVPATGASRAYDLESGEEVWSCKGMTENCIPTPIHRDGIVYLMSGYRGAAMQAIRLEGAKGELGGGEHLLWHHDRDTSYTPSALLYGGMLYFLKGNSATLTCLDAATGKVIYEDQKLDGLRTVYSSPVGADGRVYITSREGVTKVLALGAEYRELATNRLDDTFDATAALVGDELYLRGRKNLYCIAAAE